MNNGLKIRLYQRRVMRGRTRLRLPWMNEIMRIMKIMTSERRTENFKTRAIGGNMRTLETGSCNENCNTFSKYTVVIDNESRL